MGIGPGRSPGGLLIDERRFHLRRAHRKQHGKQRLLLGAGLHLQVDVPFLLEKLEFLPALCDQLAQLAGGLRVHLIIAVQSDEGQKRVSLGNGQLAASPGLILRRKTRIEVAELQPVVIRPLLPGLLPHYLLQLRETALLGEPDIVHRRCLIKVHEFIINLILFLVCARRHDAGHFPRDGDRAEVLHDADPLIALLHIEIVHVLVGLDRVAYALFLLTVAEPDPFRGELRTIVQYGHEIARERTAPSHGLRPHDTVYGHLHQSKGHLIIAAVRHDVVQNRQSRLLSPHHPCLIIFFP